MDLTICFLFSLGKNLIPDGMNIQRKPVNSIIEAIFSFYHSHRFQIVLYISSHISSLHGEYFLFLLKSRSEEVNLVLLQKSWLEKHHAIIKSEKRTKKSFFQTWTINIFFIRNVMDSRFFSLPPKFTFEIFITKMLKFLHDS